MSALAAFGFLWLAVLAAMPVLALRRARRARRTRSGEAPGRAVLIVRPCTGRPPWLASALATLPPAGGARLRLRFTLDRPDDPALPVANACAAWHRAAGHDAEVVLVPVAAPNRKAGQLLDIVARHPEVELVVVADADVDLSVTPLQDLLAPLSRSLVAAAWTPVVETEATTDADRASRALLGASLHAFPLLGRLDTTGLVGKLFAFDRARALKAGALAAGVDRLGEDMALAGALRAAGLRVAMTDVVGRSLARDRSSAAVLERFTRWMHVVRTQRPLRMLSYPLVFLGPWSLAAAASALAWVAPAPGLALLAGALGVRLAVARIARSLSGDTVQVRARDLVAADLLLARAWWGSLTHRSATWAGRRLTFAHDGLIAALPRPPEASGGSRTTGRPRARP